MWGRETTNREKETDRNYNIKETQRKGQEETERKRWKETYRKKEIERKR